jgi:hypothetical protein
VQFLEHNIQVSVLPNTLSILLSNYCFNWRSGGILRLKFKKNGKIYVVMSQTSDLYANLYATWRTTFNRLDHSLKFNRSNSYFEFILSCLHRNRISTFPPRKLKFWYFWVTLLHMWRDPHHVNFIPIVLQPLTGLFDFIYQRVSPWSNLPSLKGLLTAHAIGHDEVSTRTASPYMNKATKITIISEENTPLGSLRQKVDSGPPEWYIPKLVPTHQCKISMKSQISMSSMPLHCKKNTSVCLKFQ